MKIVNKAIQLNRNSQRTRKKVIYAELEQERSGLRSEISCVLCVYRLLGQLQPF